MGLWKVLPIMSQFSRTSTTSTPTLWISGQTPVHAFFYGHCRMSSKDSTTSSGVSSEAPCSLVRELGAASTVFNLWLLGSTLSNCVLHSGTVLVFICSIYGGVPSIYCSPHSLFRSVTTSFLAVFSSLKSFCAFCIPFRIWLILCIVDLGLQSENFRAGLK